MHPIRVRLSNNKNKSINNSERKKTFLCDACVINCVFLPTSRAPKCNFFVPASTSNELDTLSLPALICITPPWNPRKMCSALRTEMSRQPKEFIFSTQSTPVKTLRRAVVTSQVSCSPRCFRNRNIFRLSLDKIHLDIYTRPTPRDHLTQNSSTERRIVFLCKA